MAVAADCRATRSGIAGKSPIWILYIRMDKDSRYELSSPLLLDVCQKNSIKISFSGTDPTPAK